MYNSILEELVHTQGGMDAKEDFYKLQKLVIDKTEEIEKLKIKLIRLSNSIKEIVELSQDDILKDYERENDCMFTNDRYKVLFLKGFINAQDKLQKIIDYK